MSRAARVELVPARVVDRQDRETFALSQETAAIGVGRRARATEPHYLRLIAGNGQVLATSELYANKANAKRAAVAWRQAFYDVWSGGRAVVEVTE